jgi:PadR family transcriptional regulator, regulatory protein PadR
MPGNRSRCSRLDAAFLVLTFDTNGHNLLVSNGNNKPPPPMATRLDLLQGTLDLLILRTLTGDPRHGWAISERIQELSQDVLRVNQGSLYPALHRLEHQGWIVSDWGVSELGRRARFYRLTAGGRRKLERETEDWARFSTAVGRVLRFA